MTEKEVKCPLCEGSGVYEVNGIPYICPTCNGTGTVKTDQR